MRIAVSSPVSPARRVGVPAVALLVAGLLLAASGAAAAQQPPGPPPAPTPQEGLAVAQRLCRTCHLLSDGSNATVPASVPSFRAIANRRGQTAQHIMDVLIRPHWPMPDLQVTNDEIDRLLAYFESLRANTDVPPLRLPPRSAPKAGRPTPS